MCQHCCAFGGCITSHGTTHHPAVYGVVATVVVINDDDDNVGCRLQARGAAFDAPELIPNYHIYHQSAGAVNRQMCKCNNLQRICQMLALHCIDQTIKQKGIRIKILQPLQIKIAMKAIIIKSYRGSCIHSTIHPPRFLRY